MIGRVFWHARFSNRRLRERVLRSEAGRTLARSGARALKGSPLASLIAEMSAKSSLAQQGKHKEQGSLDFGPWTLL